MRKQASRRRLARARTRAALAAAEAPFSFARRDAAAAAARKATCAAAADARPPPTPAFRANCVPACVRKRVWLWLVCVVDLPQWMMQKSGACAASSCWPVHQPLGRSHADL